MSEDHSQPPVLELSDVHGWYGESHVLEGVNLRARTGEVITILGRNGAGKTTCLKAIMGLLRKRTGSIRCRGRELLAGEPEVSARMRIAYCPEERGIFASLSVEENLLLPPALFAGGLTLEQVYERFPHLRLRRKSQGTRLSGGEQQMLAIARILRTGADVFLLDEPTEGLAPVVVQDIGRIVGELKQRGMTVVLVEQNFRFASAVADRHFVMESGRIVDELTRDGLASERGRTQLRSYLGV
jgi:branched-chain amino acid transport system ATP-binding protein